MEKKRKTIQTALIALALLVVVCGTITIASSGLASAKYKQHRVAENVPVTVNVDADLADDLAVLEHKLEYKNSENHQIDEYQLSETETVTSNSYVLMPGVDIPKDPFVRVTGKTAIPAYLYIEVVDQTNSTYNYTIDSSWLPLSGCTGRNGGAVYYYKDKLQKSQGDSDPIDLNILEGKKITVAPSLDLTSNYDEAKLEFYAYMAQAADEKTAEQIYNSQIARQGI